MIFASPSRVIGGSSLGNLYVRLTMDPTDLIRGTKEAETSLSSLEAILKKVAFVSAAAFAVIGAMGVNEYRKFNQAMTESLSIMGNISDKMRKDLEDTARTISTKSVYSAAELAKSYYYIVSSGQSAAQAIKLIKPISEFATAGMMDLTKATQDLTNSQIALGLKVEDPIKNMKNLTLVADLLTKASIISDGTIQQFADALQNRFAGAMRAYNISLSQGVAILADFANAGIKGQRAGYAAFMTIRNLMNAAATHAGMFKRFGIDVFDATGKLRDFTDILSQMSDLFATATDKEKSEALQRLGIQQRQQAYLITLLGTSKSLIDLNEKLQNAAGSTKEVNDKMMGSFQNQLKEALHSLQNVAIELGQYLAPSVLALTKRIADLGDAFVKWDEKTNQVHDTIAVLGNEIKGLALGFFGIAQASNIAVNDIIGGFDRVKGAAVSTTREVVAMGIEMLYLKNHPVEAFDAFVRHKPTSNTKALVSAMNKWTEAPMNAAEGSWQTSQEANTLLAQQLIDFKNTLFGGGPKVPNYGFNFTAPNSVVGSGYNKGEFSGVGPLNTLFGSMMAPNSPFLSPMSPFISPLSPFINPSSPFINPASPLVNPQQTRPSAAPSVDRIALALRPELQQGVLDALKQAIGSGQGGAGKLLALSSGSTKTEPSNDLISSMLSMIQNQTMTTQFIKGSSIQDWYDSLQKQLDEYQRYITNLQQLRDQDVLANSDAIDQEESTVKAFLDRMAEAQKQYYQKIEEYNQKSRDILSQAAGGKAARYLGEYNRYQEQISQTQQQLGNIQTDYAHRNQMSGAFSSTSDAFAGLGMNGVSSAFNTLSQNTEEAMQRYESAVQAAMTRTQDLMAAQKLVVGQAASDMFGQWATAISTFAGKQSAEYQALFAMSKAFAIATATVDMSVAIANAFTAKTWEEAVIDAAAIGSDMATIISAISAVTLNLSGAGATKHRATGGPVYAGQPVWVGEKGVEIFTPTQDGTIIPNNMIRQGGGMSGSQTTVNIHNYSGGKASVQESQDENGKVINVIVERAKNSIASEILQGTGKVNHAISQSYGLRRGTRI